MVDQDITEGERLVQAIKANGKLFAAYWLFISESQTYQLVLSLPESSPLAAYGRIQQLLSTLTPALRIGLEDIRIVKEQDPRAIELRLSIELPGNQPLRLSNAIVGSFYIDDAYIYYLERIPTVAAEQEMIIAVKEDIRRGVPAKLTFRVGLLQDIVTPGRMLPMTRGPRGLNVDLFIFQNVTQAPCQSGSECKTHGKILQWVVRDGKTMQMIPREEDAEITLRFDSQGKLVA